MHESVKAGVHFGLAAGHAICACYHIRKGGLRNWHVLVHTGAFLYDFLAMREHTRRSYDDERRGENRGNGLLELPPPHFGRGEARRRRPDVLRAQALI